MRRLGIIAALGAILAMSGTVVTASPALARGPKWLVVPAKPFTLPAALCGFKLRVSFPADKEFAKVLTTADGSIIFLITGSLAESFTNLTTGKTVTENVSGPAKETAPGNGSFTLAAKGHNPITLTPADAQRFGLPTVSVTAGALALSVASDGSITSLSCTVTSWSTCAPP